MSEFTISRRELYLLPTRIGWYFGLILIALFAIAIKYDNQPAFMMLFILSSLGLVAMLYTHHNVVGLVLKSQPSQAVFLGETAKFPITVHNPTEKRRHAVWLLCDGYSELFALNTYETEQFTLNLPTTQRGYLVCPNIVLSSQFPIGLLFCWSKRFQSYQRCLVYPQPLDLHPLPLNDTVGKKEQQALYSHQVSNQDYNGLRPYQAGDRLRDIHWPALAKVHKLVSIQHDSRASQAVNLSWFSLPNNMNHEDKLSQLCQWVITAEQQAMRYQLEMPNNTIEYDHGLAHYHQCLKTLALWE